MNNALYQHYYTYFSGCKQSDFPKDTGSSSPSITTPSLPKRTWKKLRSRLGRLGAAIHPNNLYSE
jgi:hypothetical protein